MNFLLLLKAVFVIAFISRLSRGKNFSKNIVDALFDASIMTLAVYGIYYVVKVLV